MTTIRSPHDPRTRIELTPEVVAELVRVARTAPAYSASWHVQAMADALEATQAGWRESVENGYQDLRRHGERWRREREALVAEIERLRGTP